MRKKNYYTVHLIHVPVNDDRLMNNCMKLYNLSSYWLANFSKEKDGDRGDNDAYFFSSAVLS